MKPRIALLNKSEDSNQSLQKLDEILNIPSSAAGAA
jgi:hypothetical protein